MTQALLPLALSVTSTRAAVPLAGWPDLRIRDVVWMPEWAVRFTRVDGHWAGAAKHILAPRRYFQVLWIATKRVVALMVNVHSGGNFTARQLVRKTVHADARNVFTFPVQGDACIAGAVWRPLPNPAVIILSLADFRPEALGKWLAGRAGRFVAAVWTTGSHAGLLLATSIAHSERVRQWRP